jgi:hypothetical protein
VDPITHRLRNIIRKVEKDLKDPTPRIGSIHPTYKFKALNQDFEIWGGGNQCIIIRLIGFETITMWFNEITTESLYECLVQMRDDKVVQEVMRS